ncbi:MAG: AsmA family protein [Bryobacterales bacterium]|nr:AsmA family protein [Bryobacterales bacterium]
MTRAKRFVRTGLAVALGLLALLTAATEYLSADRFGARIRQALETSLHRKVEIGKVHFSLFHGPGFTVNDVLIGEAPTHGLAPFAYVDTLDARVSLTSLLAGNLRFSSLRLVEPTLNLVKLADGPWNVQQLLASELGRPRGSGSSAAALPEIQVRSGRVDFQFGTLKSVYYLTDADFDIWEDGGALELRFSGSPGRTDRPAQGFGRLIANGRWLHSTAGEPRVQFDIQLDRSNIADVMTLIAGRDVGVHGELASQARLSGPVSNVKVSGQLQIYDIHRWDLLPPKGEAWPLDYAGTIDLRHQRVALQSGRSDGKDLPLGVRVEASNYLTTPHWAITATAQDFPAAALIEVARHMGVALPPRASGDGKLNGELACSSDGGLRGQVNLSDASLEVPGTDPMRIASARINIAGGEIRLDPATLLLHREEKAVVEGLFRPSARALSVKISTPAFRISDLRTGTGELLGAGRLPLLDNCPAGTWRGFLRYVAEGDDPPEWTGVFEVHDASVAVPGIAGDVHLDSAAVSISGTRLGMSRIRGRAGKLNFEGEYRYEPGYTRPHRFRLVLPEAHAADIERLLLPSLQRSQGFLSRTLRIGRASIPEWLKQRRAAGTVMVGSLRAGGTLVTDLHADVIWDGVHAQLLGAEASLDGNPIGGTLSADLSGNVPMYHGLAFVDAVETRLGDASIASDFETSGVGAGALLSRLRLAGVRASIDGVRFEGKASLAGDGQIRADLASGSRQLPLTLTLFPFAIEPAVPAVAVPATRNGAAGKTP